MLNSIFAAGLVVFTISSGYFYFKTQDQKGLNTAFLVSFITLISYALMWQGSFTVVTEAGEPIYWTRWTFYALSCTLLILEIARVKGIQDGKLVESIYLTAIVMLTGFLAARDLSDFRWIYLIISTIAYGLLILKVLPGKTPKSNWVNHYIFFGWTVFPIVFIFAPTGFGLIGAAAANLLYLGLDLYTKIVFNLQLAGSDREEIPAN